LITLSYKLRE